MKPRHEIPLCLVICLIGGIAGNACAGTYDTAWRTTAATQALGRTIDIQFANHVKRVEAKCIKDKAPSVKVCVVASPEWNALRHWRDTALPSINSGLALTVTSLVIAENQKNQKLEWIAILRPVLCTLAKVADLWKQYLGETVQTITALVQGATCR